jgi:glutaredoxin
MITIYGAEWCTWCKKAKKVAEERGLPHVWKDVEDLTLYEEMKSKVPTPTSKIPQIFWYDRYIGGHDAFVAEIENTSGGYGDGKV